MQIVSFVMKRLTTDAVLPPHAAAKVSPHPKLIMIYVQPTGDFIFTQQGAIDGSSLIEILSSCANMIDVFLTQADAPCLPVPTLSVP